jgi:hypothetical protein
LTGGTAALAGPRPIAERLRAGGARLMLATNGMRLDRFPRTCGATLRRGLREPRRRTDDPRPPARRPAFARLQAGTATLRQHSRPKLVARPRSCRQRGRGGGIVAAAASLGFDYVSFLPLDASSAAFGGRPATRALVPTPLQLDRFRGDQAPRSHGTARGRFVLESAEKLVRIAEHLQETPATVPSSAPSATRHYGLRWWRRTAAWPCFFHEPVGDARQARRIRASAEYGSALDHIRGPNATCERCCCPKRRASGLLQRLLTA